MHHSKFGNLSQIGLHLTSVSLRIVFAVKANERATKPLRGQLSTRSVAHQIDFTMLRVTIFVSFFLYYENRHLTFTNQVESFLKYEQIPVI